MESFAVKNKKVLVVGLGFRTGLAAANFLASRGARVTVSDIKPAGELSEVIARLDKKVRVCAGVQDLSLLDEGTDMVVLSPGVPAGIPLIAEARRRGIPVIAEIELAYRFLKGRIVAITGTDGKSTTTSLVAHILKETGHRAVAGGNIGIPLVSLVEETGDDTISVVELSSFQLETVDRFKPDVSAILNVSPDHLDRYPGMNDYFRAKLRITGNQGADDYFIYNTDDQMIRSGLNAVSARRLGFSLDSTDADAFMDGDTLLIRENGEAVPVLNMRFMRIVGVHNAMNTMAALLMVRSVCGKIHAEMDLRAVSGACYSFPGLEHRMEVVGEAGGRTFINDSKATTVGAVEMALRSLRGENGILILGGRGKGDDYSRLEKSMRGRVKALVLIGEMSGEFSRLFSGYSQRTADSMGEAVRAAMEMSGSGDTILLSPACASYDMFTDFEERGASFKKAVRELMEASWI